MNQQSEHDKRTDIERNESEPQAPTDSDGPAAGAPSPEDVGAGWEPSPAQVHRYKNAEALAKAAARRFLASAKRAVDKNDRFKVVLAGGSTPRRLYSMLTEPPYRDSVPPDDAASNYRRVRETPFAPLEIPDHRVGPDEGRAPAAA